MTCDEFQDRLSAYLDGELPRWKRWKVQNHLQHCPECGSLMRELEEVDLCLDVSLHGHPAPEYLTQAVMHRLPAMPPAWRRPAVLTWSTGLAVAGMQAAALFGAYWWGYSRATDSGAPVDRTGVLAAPTPILPVHRSELRTNHGDRSTGYPAYPATSGVWSKPIGIVTGPMHLAPAPVRAQPAKRPRSAAPSSTIGNVPHIHLEGAR